jgi:hypothetical protein
MSFSKFFHGEGALAFSVSTPDTFDWDALQATKPDDGELILAVWKEGKVIDLASGCFEDAVEWMENKYTTEVPMQVVEQILLMEEEYWNEKVQPTNDNFYLKVVK